MWADPWQRWWRWIKNPYPQPGQVWEVDGLGLMEIWEVYEYGRRVKIRTANERSGVQRSWYVSSLRSQADPCDYTLADLSETA